MLKGILHILMSLLFLNVISVHAIVIRTTQALRDSGKVTFIHAAHFDSEKNPKNPSQRKAIFDRLNTLNQQANELDKPYVIVEDMLDYNGSHEQTKKFFYDAKHKWTNGDHHILYQDESDAIVSIETILGLFTDQCFKNKIDCYNAECRQVSYLSALHQNGPVANDVVKDYQDIVNAITHELVRIGNEAKDNNDAQIVYDAIQQILQSNAQKFAALKPQLESSSLSLQELYRIDRTQRKAANDNFSEIDLEDQFNICARELVDARILLEWYKNRLKKNIFIILGSAHIQRIKSAFKKLGFARLSFGKDPLDKAKIESDPKLLQHYIDDSLDMQQVFKKIDDICKCDICGKYLRDKRKLKKHCTLKHPKKCDDPSKHLLNPNQPNQSTQHQKSFFSQNWLFFGTIFGILSIGAYYAWQYWSGNTKA